MNGKLNYGLENVFEIYYNCELRKGLNVTFDYQVIANPGYNQDRGPVQVVSVRVHYEF